MQVSLPNYWACIDNVKNVARQSSAEEFLIPTSLLKTLFVPLKENHPSGYNRKDVQLI